MQALILESVWLDEPVVGTAESEPAATEDAENALSWLTNIGTGMASGAATGAVGGPWGALIGGLIGGGLGAVQAAQQPQGPPVASPPKPRTSPQSPPRARPANPQPAAARPARLPQARTIAVSHPATPAPAQAPQSQPPGSVDASDVARLLTTLAPMLVALGQQLGGESTPTFVVESETTQDDDRWPPGEDAHPPELPTNETDYPIESDCWPPEDEWTPGEAWLHAQEQELAQEQAQEQEVQEQEVQEVQEPNP